MKQILKDLLKTLICQLTGKSETGSIRPSRKAPEKLHFTNKALDKMKYWGLSEAQVWDVFTKGESVKEGIQTRKYNGYEIGIAYGWNNKTGQYVIFSAWKRPRL